jgi:hypothetical protein
MVMSGDEKTVDAEHVEEPVEAEKKPVTEEIKVQAEDLFKAINNLIREGAIRRVTVIRNDRILMDIPLSVGAVASVVLAVQMPVLASLSAVAALLGGCTVRIEREEPSTEA